MAASKSPPRRIGRWLSGIARQLELPLCGEPRPSPAAPPASPPVEPKPATPHGANRRSIRLGERSVDYAFRRGRRRTIGLTITADGLSVAAPRWVSIAQVEEAIRERESWIFTKLTDLRRQRAAVPQVRWEDGGTLPYLGRMLTIRLATTTRRSASTRFDGEGHELTVALPAGATASHLREHVEAWLHGEARVLFRERLAFYETRLGVAHRALRLSSAKTRWGSCSADGRILLNWRLIHFPLASIDYVVAHELAHLKEMNHGPRFWSTVAAILPGYEAAREHVKNPPPELLPTF